MKQQRFWYSANQRKWFDYVDANPILRPKPPAKGANYALINGRLLEYTECYGGNDPNYSPAYDDVEFLGYGEYACNDWNIKTYLKKHPEVRLGKAEEWPEVIGEHST